MLWNLKNKQKLLEKCNNMWDCRFASLASEKTLNFKSKQKFLERYNKMFTLEMRIQQPQIQQTRH